MTTLRRLLAICVLTVSLSGVAVADGGETQGPPLLSAPPAPECITDCSDASGSTPDQPAEEPSVDIVTEAVIFANWLAMSIL